MKLFERVFSGVGYLLRRSIFWFGFYIRPPIHWFVGLFSKVGNPPVFGEDVFLWRNALEDHWEEIRDEALRMLENRDRIPPLREVSPDHSRIAVDEKWKSLFIWGYNYKFEHNAQQCPVTAREAEKVPGLISAFYSIHEPGTHLPRHYGPTKGIVTCHLALQVPKQKGCRIAVDDHDYEWQEGKCFIFDDTYYHEVWNDTDEDRVILLIQLERPLRQPGKAVSDAFMWLIRRSPFVKTTLKQARAWEQRVTGGTSQISEMARSRQS
ncbi:MAG: hypothetical protein Tsb002_08850 [Wenzhouxiangellaceae bacterium]